MPNPSTPTTGVIPTGGFDPLYFWDQHKMQIVIYAVVLGLGALVFGLYEFNEQHRAAKAQEIFARASTEQEYTQIIQDYPRSVEAGNAHLLLAQKLRARKDYEGSIATLRDFIDKQPNHPLIDGAYLSIASDLEAEGKTSEAIDGYQQIISRFDNCYSAPVAQMARANLLRSQGNVEEARRAYENVQAQFPESYFSQEAMQETRLLRK
jgi:TolA-binding protein